MDPPSSQSRATRGSIYLGLPSKIKLLFCVVINLFLEEKSAIKSKFTYLTPWLHMKFNRGVIISKLLNIECVVKLLFAKSNRTLEDGSLSAKDNNDLESYYDMTIYRWHVHKVQYGIALLFVISGPIATR